MTTQAEVDAARAAYTGSGGSTTTGDHLGGGLWSGQESNERNQQMARMLADWRAAEQGFTTPASDPWGAPVTQGELFQYNANHAPSGYNGSGSDARQQYIDILGRNLDPAGYKTLREQMGIIPASLLTPEQQAHFNAIAERQASGLARSQMEKPNGIINAVGSIGGGIVGGMFGMPVQGAMLGRGLAGTLQGENFGDTITGSALAGGTAYLSGAATDAFSGAGAGYDTAAGQGMRGIDGGDWSGAQIDANGSLIESGATSFPVSNSGPLEQVSNIAPYGTGENLIPSDAPTAGAYNQSFAPSDARIDPSQNADYGGDNVALEPYNPNVDWPTEGPQADLTTDSQGARYLADDPMSTEAGQSASTRANIESGLTAEGAPNGAMSQLKEWYQAAKDPVLLASTLKNRYGNDVKKIADAYKAITGKTLPGTKPDGKGSVLGGIGALAGIAGVLGVMNQKNPPPVAARPGGLAQGATSLGRGAFNAGAQDVSRFRRPGYAEGGAVQHFQQGGQPDFRAGMDPYAQLVMAENAQRPVYVGDSDRGGQVVSAQESPTQQVQRAMLEAKRRAQMGQGVQRVGRSPAFGLPMVSRAVGGPAAPRTLSEKKSHFFSQLRGNGAQGLQGDTGGQADAIPAMLADGEYVMDAETVAHLGDGNNAAGAKKLDGMRENIRKHKRAGPLSSIPKPAKKPEQYLPKKV